MAHIRCATTKSLLRERFCGVMAVGSMKTAAAQPNVDPGGVAFVTTHWSVVLTAQGHSPAADEALEKLCRSYWRPIYSFVRRDGRTVEDAQDLTQGFFARLLERRDFDAV